MIYYSQWFIYFMKILTPEQILEQIKTITGDSFDNDLAKRLGVSKQSISQYKHKSSIDLQLRIISLLIETIEEKNILTSRSTNDS